MPGRSAATAVKRRSDNSEAERAAAEVAKKSRRFMATGLLSSRFGWAASHSTVASRAARRARLNYIRLILPERARMSIGSGPSGSLRHARYHGQDNVRGMLGVVVDRVRGHDLHAVVVQRLARVRVDVESREVAAGHVHANAMPALEH